jgi:hypothetical protein
MTIQIFNHRRSSWQSLIVRYANLDAAIAALPNCRCRVVNGREVVFERLA